MAKSFYLRMAAANLKRDRKMYVPYAVSYVIFAAIYFMVITLMTTDGLKNVPAGGSLQAMFTFGMIIMSFMTVIFMLYINSFLMKRRKKEFGLYGILGLEKRHVGRIIFYENFILSLTSLGVGILSGCTFGNLIFLLLLHTLKVSPDSRFSLPWQAFIYTGALFIIIYFLNTIYNFVQVRLANPIDLLKGEHIGERKVRFVLIKTLIGMSFLVIAYYMANTVTNGVAAITKFFLAVILVIGATYFLFQAGSQFILKRLKKRKNFYYKANNFVAIAGMFHRMKQNAAGLATICILSTMVLVTVSTCAALYIGQEEMINNMNPNDVEITISSQTTEEQLENIKEAVKKEAAADDISIQEMYGYQSYSSMIFLKDGKFFTYGSEGAKESGVSDLDIYGFVNYIEIIPLSDYTALTGDVKELDDGEVMLLIDKKTAGRIKEKALGADYKIKEVRSDSPILEGKNAKLNEAVIVVADEENGEKLIRNWLSESPKKTFEQKIIMNVEGNQEQLLDFSGELDTIITSIVSGKTAEANPIIVRSIYLNKMEGYSIYGGLLFMGIFFTIMFLAATVLIIYFKQISEGYDDRERYVILQKVGMDDTEVKKTINRQILLVFFLPLAAAMLHVGAARHMILKMLTAFSLTNTALTTVCILVSCIVFAVIYVFVYQITARMYYRIIKY